MLESGMIMQKCLTIRLKGLIEEDFINYKKPSMFLATSICDWKCCIEQNIDVSICQNSTLASQNTIGVSIDKIIDRYINNPLTQSIVMGGLEPFLQFDEILSFIKEFRIKCNDDIVIYTGYYESEIQNEINMLKQFSNIIIKFGRFKPNDKNKFDDVLGIELASNNQYAIKIS